MPLPHFLMMLVTVILAAALTLWAGVAVGVPLVAMLLIALTAAALLHLRQRGGHDQDG